MQRSLERARREKRRGGRDAHGSFRSCGVRAGCRLAPVPHLDTILMALSGVRCMSSPPEVQDGRLRGLKVFFFRAAHAVRANKNCPRRRPAVLCRDFRHQHSDDLRPALDTCDTWPTCENLAYGGGPRGGIPKCTRSTAVAPCLCGSYRHYRSIWGTCGVSMTAFTSFRFSTPALGYQDALSCTAATILNAQLLFAGTADPHTSAQSLRALLLLSSTFV